MEEVAKCLADSTRRRLLEYISKSSQVACLSVRAEFDLSQPTISHHLAKLVEAGLVVKQKRGTENFYSVNKPALKKYVSYLESLYG